MRRRWQRRGILLQCCWCCRRHPSCAPRPPAGHATPPVSRTVASCPLAAGCCSPEALVADEDVVRHREAELAAVEEVARQGGRVGEAVGVCSGAGHGQGRHSGAHGTRGHTVGDVRRQTRAGAGSAPVTASRDAPLPYDSQRNICLKGKRLAAAMNGGQAATSKTPVTQAILVLAAPGPRQQAAWGHGSAHPRATHRRSSAGTAR